MRNDNDGVSTPAIIVDDVQGNGLLVSTKRAHSPVLGLLVCFSKRVPGLC